MTTTLPPSPSDAAASRAFDLLHPGVQRWIWKRKWNGLRDIQERAVPVVLAGDRDVLISAATAGGKTEAAFLPIVSAVAEDDAPGIKVLALSPLKALINDQFRRIEDLCEEVRVPVHRRHGDVPQGERARLRKSPGGILLTTPESLEASLCREGSGVARLFAGLRYIVVDELHAFIGTERGMQLASLMHRVETVLGRRTARVGLSATLGDMKAAAAVLRPDDPDRVVLLESAADSQELRLQVRGYVEGAPVPSAPDDLRKRKELEEASEEALREDISAHLYKTMRGSSNLVFAGSRRNVELYADTLREMSEKAGVPNEFFPHHGNLSKDLRETLEARLKDGRLPTSAVCTTTLELGIDIGDVKSVAQIGAPYSIAGLRQRMGRSGRRPGAPVILRIYVPEEVLSPITTEMDRLRLETVMTVAGVRLLLQKWCEPPPPKALHLSTLVHQTLSMISQHGGASAARLYDTLCGKGPFAGIDRATFAAVLRSMGSEEAALIEQAEDGVLLLGEGGERIVGSHMFYPIFETPEEFTVVAKGKTLGTVPVDTPLKPEDFIVFAGRRWKVLDIHDREKILQVEAAKGGKLLTFGGDPAPIHDRLAAETRSVFEADDEPAFLDNQALEHLRGGRGHYRARRLDAAGVLPEGERTLLFPWVGTRKSQTLALALAARGIKAQSWGLVVVADALADEVLPALTDIASEPAPDPLDLAASVANKVRLKYDRFLDDALLDRQLASSVVDAATLPSVARGLLERDAALPPQGYH